MTKPNLKITVTSEQLALLNSPPAWLARTLSYCRRRFEPGGSDGLRESVTDVALCEPDIEGRLVFPAGLMQRVIQALRVDGQDVEIDDKRPGEPPCHDYLVLESVNEQELGFLQAIMDHPLGTLEIPSPHDAAKRCLLIARAFSLARIAIAVPTRRQARKLWWRMEDALQERVGLIAGTAHKKGERCIVGTFEGLNHLSGEWDMLLLPWADTSTGNTDALVVARLHRRIPRCYGLVVAHRRRDDRQRLRLECIAGHVIAPLTKPRSPVYVSMATVPSVAVKQSASGLEGKRALYWTSAERNQRIAEVCRAAAASDAKGLNNLGLDMLNFAAICDSCPPKIAVLVETVEHARELAKLLPDWPVSQGPRKVRKTRKTASNEQSDKPHRAQPAALPNKRIVVAVYAAQHKVGAHVLVRATGGAGLPCVKGFPPKTEYGKEPPPVLLIDFADTYDATATKYARRRTKEYERAGMHLLRTARAMKRKDGVKSPAPTASGRRRTGP